MPGPTDDSGVRAASRAELREGEGALEARGEGDGAIRRGKAAGMRLGPLDEAATRRGRDRAIYRAFVTLSGYVPGHSIRAALACGSRMIVLSRPGAGMPGPRGPHEFSATGGSCRRAALAAGDTRSSRPPLTGPPATTCAPERGHGVKAWVARSGGCAVVILSSLGWTLRRG